LQNPVAGHCRTANIQVWKPFSETEHLPLRIGDAQAVSADLFDILFGKHFSSDLKFTLKVIIFPQISASGIFTGRRSVAEPLRRQSVLQNLIYCRMFV